MTKVGRPDTGAGRPRLRTVLAAGAASLAAMAMVGLGTLPAEAASTTSGTPAVENCGLGSSLVRPSSLILTCADQGMAAEKLHWTSWSDAGATATATVAWSENGSRKSTTADITLSAPVSESGGKELFTKLGMRVTGATPSGFVRDDTFSQTPVSTTTTGAAAKAVASEQAASAKSAAVTPAASGGSGVISYSDIAGYWELAGGPDSDADTAAAITGAESSAEPGAIQADEAYSTTGWGLWQITPGDSEPTYGVDYQMLDPWNNAEAAVAKYYGDDNFDPWTTYVDGAYETYLPAAEADSPDTDLSDPGQFDPTYAYGTTVNGSSSDPGETYGPAIPSSPALTNYYQVSFQVNNDDLGSYNSADVQTTSSLGMEAGTNPASAQLSDGTFMAAFQDNQNDLYMYKWNSETKLGTSYGMDAGTSPALGALPTDDQWVAAFQSNTHYLYIDKSNGDLDDTGLQMEAGTSPAIAVQPDGDWTVAFTSNDGLLTTYDSAGSSYQTTDGMNSATSPSIAALSDGATYEVAFEANDNDLSLYHTGVPGDTDDTSYPMAADTDPSIAESTDGNWEVAWESNNDELGTADSAGNSKLISDGMYAGTSPSVAPLNNGTFEIAFEANSDWLSIFDTSGATKDTTYGMDAGTSPSLAIPAA